LTTSWLRVVGVVEILQQVAAAQVDSALALHYQ
jgi:hypothetical protein